MDIIKRKFNLSLMINPYVYMILSIIFLEILIRINIVKTIHFSFIYIIISAIAIGLALSIISKLFNKKVNTIIYSFFLLLLGVYFCAQILYFDFFKTFLAINSIGNGGQVAEFYKDIIQLFLNNILWIILCLLPFVFFIFYARKHININKVEKQELLTSFVICVLSFILNYAMLYLPSSSLNTPLDLYKEATLNELTVDQLGMSKSAILDIKTFFFGKNAPTQVAPPIEKEPEIVYDPQVMNIDFDKLINETSNGTIKNMHQYFKNVTPSQKNEYTGMFKDYNVILITAEGFSHYAIDKEITPTLYKLANTGFVFKDFYTPLWNVSTSDGEYVAMQGLIPKYGVWSFKKSSSNYLPFTLGKQYQKQGYKTIGYHNHSYTYYARDISHPNVGYDFRAPRHGLNITKQWPESDLEMMENSIDHYINEDRFHTYYMTVSGHTNYTYQGNMMARKNKDVVNHLNYSELTKGYLATQVELDRALEHLIKRLEEAGKADKTLIVMSADHYPYGLPESNYNELAGHEIEGNFEIMKNSLIIWSASMKKPIVVDKATSSLDILPTVSNLLGLEYDSRLLMGTDVMSSTPPLIIFSNKSFITDKVKYNAKTQEVTWLNGTSPDEEYLKQMNNIVKQKFDYSALILDNNYYKHVFNGN